MSYINIKNENGVTETVDEFENRKEALEMVKEYNSASRLKNYYVSRRCTKEWEEK